MQFGKLTFEPATEHLDLLAAPTERFIKQNELAGVLVSEINPELSDTAAFCDFYDIGMDVSANCVIVAAKRGDHTWYAACLILASARADINGTVRRHLDARKISFAPMETAISLTHMEYGGVTLIGLPEEWPILIDTDVAQTAHVIIGSGIRKSKLLVPGNLLAGLPQATVLSLTKTTDS